jgi:hypothetical protein
VWGDVHPGISSSIRISMLGLWISAVGGLRTLLIARKQVERKEIGKGFKESSKNGLLDRSVLDWLAVTSNLLY